MATILTLPSVNAYNWLKQHSHGIVWNRPDHIRARCMGPPTEDYKGCEQCNYEQIIVGLLVELGRIDRSECTAASGLTSYAEQHLQ